MPTKSKASPIEFLRQVRAEMKKVTWPSRQETIAGTVSVFIMVILASLFLYFADQIIGFVVGLILSIGV